MCTSGHQEWLASAIDIRFGRLAIGRIPCQPLETSQELPRDGLPCSETGASVKASDLLYSHYDNEGQTA